MPKKKLLVYSDSVTAGTGFGIVSKHVLRALNDLFEIDQLAINFGGEFINKEEFPYQIVPSRLNDPKDPYGSQMFLQSLARGVYDYVWVMNDTFVVEEVAKKIPQLFQQMRAAGKKVPVIVYYYPVDCHVLDTGRTMLQVADRVVAYCKFGKAETEKTAPDVLNKLSIINHGVDTGEFHKIAPDRRKEFRQKFFNIQNDNTFVWLQVNRNSPRKDIPRTILAFKKFKEEVYPNSLLYLHTAPRDTTIDLIAAVRDVGLDPTRDVIFPKNYAASKPFPIEILNLFYNCGDAFITTTLGEGWGLSHLEGAATGLPLVCPDNTCFPEQLDDGNRGYLYECNEKIWIDNSGYRPIGLVDDIVSTMKECYEDVKSGEAKKKVDLCNEYIDTIQWYKIGEQWIELFRDIDSGKISLKSTTASIGEVL